MKEDSAALISERFKINITVKTYKAVRLSLILLVVGLVVSGFYIWITGGFDYEIIGFLILIFLGSVIPNTLFDFVGIISGSTGFPMRRFLGAVFIGKTLKSMWVSMVCMYGFDRLINVYNKWGTI